MNNLNPFYSVRGNSTGESVHQLEDLGAERHHITVGGGRTGSYDWGNKERSESKTYNRATTSEDYDRNFAYRLCKIKPAYEIDEFLDYHYTYYIQKGQQETIFLKHMKYVILPLMVKTKNPEPFVTLLTEWINNKSANTEQRPDNI